MKYSLSSDTWGEEEKQAILDVMENGRYTMGPKVAQFEKEFAEYFDVPYAIMVNSGSSANLLMWSLMVNKEQLHGNVIVPAVSWSTTYFPLLQNHFMPNFVDVDLDTLNIDVDRVEKAIDADTVAIFAVNLLGNSCDYKKLLKIADEENLVLLEDNCESLGAISNVTTADIGNSRIVTKKCGTLGRMGSFSFFFSHHMQTMEGGMIVCHDKDDYDYLRSLRAHGWCRDLPDDNNLYQKTGDPFKDSFTFITPGYSVRPLEMSGAIGSVQLKKCDRFIEQRRKNAKIFQEKFSDLPNIKIQKEIGKSSYFGFSIILTDELEGRRDEVIKKLTELGVETRPIIAGNFMRQPVIEYFNYTSTLDGTPNADYLHDNGFFIGNDVIDLYDNLVMVKKAIGDIK